MFREPIGRPPAVKPQSSFSGHSGLKLDPQNPAPAWVHWFIDVSLPNV